MIMMLVLLSTPINAEIVLVVNSASGLSELNKTEVVRIYTGRYTVMPNGDRIAPYDHPVNSAIRARFYKSLLNKTVAEMNSYWARLLFSGRAKPPRQLSSSIAEMAEMLKNNRNAIVYMNSVSVKELGNVKIVYVLTDDGG